MPLRMGMRGCTQALAGAPALKEAKGPPAVLHDASQLLCDVLCAGGQCVPVVSMPFTGSTYFRNPPYRIGALAMPVGCQRVLSVPISIGRASSAHLKAVCSLLGPAAKQSTDRQMLRVFSATARSA